MNEPPWLALARAQIGVVEGPGRLNNPAVLRFYEEAGHPEIRADAVPWCAAFVGAMLKRAGIRPSGSLAARSYETWGQRLDRPRLGCVAVKTRPGGSWVGHVGFVVAASPSTIHLLGGNQADRVSIASFPRQRFTAFRWPPGIAVPAGAMPSAGVAGAVASPAEA